MSKLSDFEREYFLQTRKELSAARRELDQMLYLIILVLGAIAFAMIQSDSSRDFFGEPYALIPLASALMIITSLFKIRRGKLQEMANRWFVLKEMLLRHFPDESIEQLLEGVVVSGIGQKQYVTSNVINHVILSTPIYFLLFVSAQGFSLHMGFRIAIAASMVLLHLVVSSAILWRRLKNPPATVDKS